MSRGVRERELSAESDDLDLDGFLDVHLVGGPEATHLTPLGNILVQRIRARRRRQRLRAQALQASAWPR